MIELVFIILMITLGLAILIKGADILVEGSADLARYLKVPAILIGLTIVAFGTSLPEFIVSLFSVLGDKADISIGNIVGSNIANIALVIGICALITPLAVKSKTLMKELPFLIVSSFLLLILGSDFFIFQQDTFSLGRIDGLILLTIFFVFMVYIFRSLKSNHTKSKVKKEFRAEFKHKNPVWKNVTFILGGVLALVAGGRIFIIAASRLGELAGISDAFIGLVIAALGTSLPELATCGVAAWKKHGDIAIGNIVGSNIFNVLIVGGSISLIKPFSFNPSVLAIDGVIMIFLTLLFLLFATTDQKISRKEGIVLLSLYLIYVGFLIWRL